MAEVAIGIDLGTSNSCVAIARGRKRRGASQRVRRAHHGERGRTSTRTARCWSATPPSANVIHDPEHTVASAKRLIGRYFFSRGSEEGARRLLYKIVDGPNHCVRIKVRDELFSLPEISAMVLREMKRSPRRDSASR